LLRTEVKDVKKIQEVEEKRAGLPAGLLVFPERLETTGV
jgi:hypothetical protein